MSGNNRDELHLLREQYLENERSTNRIVSVVSLVFVVISVFCEFMLEVDYSESIQIVHRSVFLPICGVILLFFIIARARNYADPWIKYMLLSGIVFMAVGSFFAYTVYMSYMIFLPVFISARYFNHRFMITVSATTLLLFLLACFLNLRLEASSELIRMMHAGAAYNSWQHTVDALFYIIMPMTLTFLFVTAQSINETDSGRRLLRTRAQSMLRTAAVEAELNMASDIQRSALPEPRFTSPDGHFAVAAQEIPAKEVCGDFYDYFMINDHTLAVLIADVSDKGAPAAMFMMSAKKALQCAILCSSDLGNAIELANRLICQDNKSDMFLTLWLGIIDTRSGVGKYVNAGHPLPLLKSADGSIRTLANEPDLFLGSFPDAPPQVNSFRMFSGDTLLLYTDGLTDAQAADGSRFGDQRLSDAIKTAPFGADATVNSAAAAATRFALGSEQFDDMTLLALTCIEPEQPIRLRLDATADQTGTAAVIDAMDKLLNELHCPDDKRRSIDMITDELCANISDYAYENGSGTMQVEAEALSNFITLRFIDSGRPFDPLAQADPLFSDEPQLGGLGIFFVRSSADEMSYQYSDGRNVLTVSVIWNI